MQYMKFKFKCTVSLFLVLFFLFFFFFGFKVCDDVATQVLGKSVFVNWPHLEEARVIAVSDGEVK